jgi:hypothetical protein
MTRLCLLVASAGALLFSPAYAAGTLRIAMTASDIPTTTGMPNNGFEGMRFLGYPVFEGLVLWDLSRSDRLAVLRPGLAERWEQLPDDKKTWVFHLRRGVKFHDDTDFTADAVIWNLDRYFRNESPQYEPAASGMTLARVPIMADYRKMDDFTVAISTRQPASYFPYMAVYILFTSPASFERAGRDWSRAARGLIAPVKAGKMSPRVFVQKMIQLGLTALLANAMLAHARVALAQTEFEYKPTKHRGGALKDLHGVASGPAAADLEPRTRLIERFEDIIAQPILGGLINRYARV